MSLNSHNEPTRETDMPATPSPRAFPSLWQGIVLCGLSIYFYQLVYYPSNILAFAYPDWFRESFNDAISCLSAVGKAASVVVTIAFARWWSGTPLWTLLGLRRFRISLLGPIALCTVGLHILTLAVNLITVRWIMGPAYLDRWRLYESSVQWGVILLLVVIAPLTEEPLFRGILLNGFRRNYGAVFGALFVSFLFGLIHFYPTSQSTWRFAGAFVVGLMFSWWMIETGSVWPCIFGHALYNGLTPLRYYCPVPIPGVNRFTSDVHFVPWWFVGLGLVCGAAGFISLWRMFGAKRRAGLEYS